MVKVGGSTNGIFCIENLLTDDLTKEINKKIMEDLLKKRKQFVIFMVKVKKKYGNRNQETRKIH